MSWIRVWVHYVITTKNREGLLNSAEIRKTLFDHIKLNSSNKGIWIDSVGGWKDHIHCLVSLGHDQSISKIAQLIKGESSFWINQNMITDFKFAWQDDYWAVGVSESHIPEVRKYIMNQENHHKVKTFEEEYNDFIKKYGWDKINSDK